MLALLTHKVLLNNFVTDCSYLTLPYKPLAKPQNDQKFSKLRRGFKQRVYFELFLILSYDLTFNKINFFVSIKSKN